MKAVLFSVVLAVTAFLASTEDKNCYDYELVMKMETETCTKCRETDKERPDMCLYKAWGMTDADGNLLVSAVKKMYEDNLLKPSVKKDIMNAFDDCGKAVTGPLKEDKKPISDLWKCGVAGVQKVCPDFEPFYTEWQTREDLKECFSYI